VCTDDGAAQWQKSIELADALAADNYSNCFFIVSLLLLLLLLHRSTHEHAAAVRNKTVHIKDN